MTQPPYDPPGGSQPDPDDLPGDTYPPPPPGSGSQPGSSFPPPPQGGGPGEGFPPPPPGSGPGGGYPPPPPPTGFGGGFGAPGLKPNRANLILVLGIVGLLCCSPVAIAAFVMGRKDLAEMDAGLMDPSGRSTTNVGRILGIVGIVFLVLSLIYVAFALPGALTSAS